VALNHVAGQQGIHPMVLLANMQRLSEHKPAPPQATKPATLAAAAATNTSRLSGKPSMNGLKSVHWAADF
jgi:hypothetical protein